MPHLNHTFLVLATAEVRDKITQACEFWEFCRIFAFSMGISFYCLGKSILKPLLQNQKTVVYLVLTAVIVTRTIDIRA